MVNGSIQSELSRFFQTIHETPITEKTVSAAAFCKARKKFSYEAFKELNDCLVDTFYDSCGVRTWHGFRLLAVDGSVTQLPNSEELMNYYGKARAHSYNPAVRVSQLYDVRNKLTIDMQVASHKMGERDLSLPHLDCARKGDIIIYDRGYPAMWLFTLLQQKEIDYCARTIVNSYNVVKDFVSSGKTDLIIALPCIEKSLRRCRKMELPTKPINVRLVRVELPSGEIEVLMTSLLDTTLFPASYFKDLYHQRWGVEEDYKLLKSRMDVENFSGLSVEAILQDIHAKVLTKNIAAVGIYEADKIKDKKFQHRKKEYRINSTYALSQLKDNVVRFLLFISPSQDLIQRFITRIASVTDIYRPERSYSRDKIRKNWKKYNMAYKRTA